MLFACKSCDARSTCLDYTMKGAKARKNRNLRLLSDWRQPNAPCFIVFSLEKGLYLVFNGALALPLINLYKR